MKCMSNLTDKFVPSIILFTANFRVQLVEKKYKYLSWTGS